MAPGSATAPRPTGAFRSGVRRGCSTRCGGRRCATTTRTWGSTGRGCRSMDRWEKSGGRRANRAKPDRSLKARKQAQRDLRGGRDPGRPSDRRRQMKRAHPASRRSPFAGSLAADLALRGRNYCGGLQGFVPDVVHGMESACRRRVNTGPLRRLTTGPAVRHAHWLVDRRLCMSRNRDWPFRIYGTSACAACLITCWASGLSQKPSRTSRLLSWTTRDTYWPWFL